MYCAKCGKKLSGDDKYCPQCGNVIAGGIKNIESETGFGATLESRGEGAKTAPVCAKPGCEHAANLRCDDCGNVYCIEHIRRVRDYHDTHFEFACDSCIAKRDAAAKAKVNETKSENFKFLIACVASLLVGIAILALNRDYNPFFAIIGLLLAGFGVRGLWAAIT